MTLLLPGGAAAEPVPRHLGGVGAALPPEAPVPETLAARDITRAPGRSEHRAGEVTTRNGSQGQSLAAAQADGAWLGW